ncbi:hypothetical protein GGR56DRAFT_636493 [Xylariaceae sp. FL0804]|nr:hypothetical protein GGR56DRAFT_636493 [Xylariaceae sp. FL0804]
MVVDVLLAHTLFLLSVLATTMDGYGRARLWRDHRFTIMAIAWVVTAVQTITTSVVIFYRLRARPNSKTRIQLTPDAGPNVRGLSVAA